MEFIENDFVVDPEEHINLVWYVVRKFYTTKIVHCEIEDLFQVGCIGLIKAAKSFDAEKGFQFATFAMRVITNEILMLLRKERRLQYRENLCLYSPMKEQNDFGEKLLFIDTLESGEKIDDELFVRELKRILNEKDKYPGRTNNMRERDVALIRMRMEDRKQREMARELNISQSYVSRRVVAVKEMVDKEWGLDHL